MWCGCQGLVGSQSMTRTGCFFFPVEEEALHVNQLANCSNVSRQIKDTSGIRASTAQPSTGEAASPWQAMRIRHDDNLGNPPSLGGRIQSRKAPGMQ